MENFMSIIKVEINVPEAVSALQKFKNNRLKAFEELGNDIKESVGKFINELLNAEMDLYLGEVDQIDNKKNGYKDRTYALKGIGGISIKMPQDRKSGFNSSIIPKGERMDPRLKEDMAVLNLAGLSTRTLAMISKRLLGVEVSKDTVSSSLELVSGRAGEWLRRPLERDYWALYIDGTNFNIQRRGSTEKEPSLVVLGIDDEGYKSILAIEPGYKDSADAWLTLFKELKARGLNQNAVRIGIMDGLPGLEKAFKEEFPKAVTQRCWVHSLKNALNKCPKRLREAFKTLADKIMYASSQDTARVAFADLKMAMKTDASRAINCLEKDLESLLTFYTFDKSYWRPLRTTNPIERINRELKRRTKPMGTVGEQTLETLVAFVALKLEMNWRRNKVNAKHFDKLSNMRKNAVEEVIQELIQ